MTARCSMTKACTKCGEIYWVVQGHACTKRACHGRPGTRAQIADLQRQIVALGKWQEGQDEAWTTWREVSGGFAEPTAVPRQRSAAATEALRARATGLGLAVLPGGAS